MRSIRFVIRSSFLGIVILVLSMTGLSESRLESVLIPGEAVLDEITVTSPNGGETWNWNSAHNITWTSTGAIANVKIEYSTNNGGAWTLVTASTPNDGTHPWTLPYAASTQCLVRISDASNPSVFDVSNTVFTIRSDGTEPNNDSASAAVLPLGTTTENLVYDAVNGGEIDWYKFFVPPADAGKDLKVNVRVTSPYPNPIPPNWTSDIDFELLDGALAVRGLCISASDNETLYLANAATGWYYIYVPYCTSVYADSSTYARYSVTLETGTSFGLGYLSGRVVNGGGAGIPQIFLKLSLIPENWAISFPIMTSGPDGYFTIGTPPGSYALQAAGTAGGRADSCANQAPINVISEYYNDKTSPSLADPVAAVAGQTANLQNIVLGTGAIVTGHVTNVGNNPLSNVWATGYDTAGNTAGAQAKTDASGNYTLMGVPVGGAKIRFSRSSYSAEFYNDKPTFGSADLLATVAGGTIPNINAQLTTGGWISGTVKDGSANGLAVDVRLYSTLDESWRRATVTSAAGTGVFNFWNVQPGDYKIYFDSTSAGYSPEWYADAGTFAAATVLTVTEGTGTTGIDGVLALIPRTLTLTSPNGGESWVWGSAHDITWNSTGAITNVALEYSTNNGADWTVIIASTANDGVASWTIPYAPSTQVKVRVSDASDATVFDASNAVFTLLSDATEPNDVSGSAAVLPLGTTGNLVYDAYNGGSDTDWYKFFVPPADAGKDLKVNVRVTSPYPDPIPAGWRSDLDFELLDGALALRGLCNSGSDNETLYLANAASGWYYISVDYCSTVYADSTDHARYSVTLETGTAFGLGYLSGRVVNVGGNGIAQVYLTLAHNPANIAVSFPVMTSGPGGYFTIAYLPGSYTLLAEGSSGGVTGGSPNLPSINVISEYYNDKTSLALSDPLAVVLGRTENLQDIVLGIGAIVTGRVTDGGGTPLINVWANSYDVQGTPGNRARTNANGEYSITGVPVGGAKIRFSRTGYASEYYNNRPSFGSGDLLSTVAGGTFPNINAQLTAGGSISGTVKDGSGSGLSLNVRLYSVLDETFQRASTTSASGTGVFNFANVQPGDYKIYFNSTAAGYTPEWYADTGAFGSATVLTVTEGAGTTGVNGVLALIPATLTVTSPNGGESWEVGSAHNITWTSAGAVGNVRIEYSTDNGGVWTDVSASTANDGTHPWTIPGSLSTQCLIRISQAAGGAPSDVSDAVFSIVAVPAITVTSPNGGESWEVGSAHNITWTSAGAVGNVRIEYSTNNGGAWTDVAASTANDGTHPWTIPGSLSTQCLIRISQAAGGAPSDASNAAFSIVPHPAIGLNRTTLTFGASSGVQTQNQTVTVSNAGGGTLNWTATPSTAWISATPGSGTGTGTVTVGIDATGLAAGAYSGTVVFSDPSATNSPRSVTVDLNVYEAGGTQPPFGDFATPLDGATGLVGAIPVTGWVLDDIETTKVEIWRDPVLQAGELNSLYFIGNGLFVEGPRPDIEAGYPASPRSYAAGWGYMLLTNFLPNHGNGTYKLYAIATDKEGNQITLGTKTITCDNANATKPFGTIDTPGQGGTASGSAFVNFGWVLTPQPGTVPKDGHLITVFVDGVLLGNLSTPPNLYNAYRSDVSNNFPGLKNTGGPGVGEGGPIGAFFINTTGYANGVHSIFWIAYDDLGRGEGIGSRFFNILNVGGAPEPALAPPATDPSLVPTSFTPVPVRTGFDLGAESRPRHPDADGVVRIEIPEVSRVEIMLGAEAGAEAAEFKPGEPRFSGYMIVGNELRPLPVGSTLDRRAGRFSWMPGPGFVGTYDLVFVKEDNDGDSARIRIRIDISPKR